jgi:hypothetical protein
MAEKLAQLKKKGGALSETLLYQNATPAAVGASTITLNQSYLKFDFIKIVYARFVGDLNNTMEIIVPTTFFANIGYIGQASKNRLTLASGDSGGSGGCRYIHPLSGTSIEFSEYYLINSAGTNPNLAIIKNIYGLKY